MIISNIKAQEYSNTPNGLRVKKGEKNYFRIYKNNDFKIDTTDYRRLDPSVYFEISKNNKEIKFNKKTYVLISIPGVRCLLSINTKNIIFILGVFPIRSAMKNNAFQAKIYC